MTYSHRPAGESLVLLTWLMSEPFAQDTLGERILSLSAEIQGERLHVISLMTRLPGNSFGPLALLNVYAGGTDTVTRLPVERFDIELYYMADKHEALDMGLSYTCHGAFCTENEVYHFDNVFFKIGEDEARLMSPSQSVFLGTGYQSLQRSGLIRASVGLAFQAELSSNPSSTYQPFDEYICHLWQHCSYRAVRDPLLCSRPLRHRGRQCSVHSALHFDFGVELACSAAARAPPRSPSLWAPLLRLLALCPRYEASTHPEGCRRRIRLGSVLPSSSSTCSSLSSPTRGEKVNRGVRTCFPDEFFYFSSLSLV